MACEFHDIFKEGGNLDLQPFAPVLKAKFKFAPT